MSSKFPKKLDAFLGLAYHNAFPRDEIIKSIKEYVVDNPSFKGLLANRLAEVSRVPEGRCHVSKKHKEFLTEVMEKLNG